MNFEQWWNEIGSGLPPRASEDQEMHVMRVAKLASEAERERCAKICEELFRKDLPLYTEAVKAAYECSEAIRSDGEK